MQICAYHDRKWCCLDERIMISWLRFGSQNLYDIDGKVRLYNNVHGETTSITEARKFNKMRMTFVRQGYQNNVNKTTPFNNEPIVTVCQLLPLQSRFVVNLQRKIIDRAS